PFMAVTSSIIWVVRLRIESLCCLKESAVFFRTWLSTFKVPVIMIYSPLLFVFVVGRVCVRVVADSVAGNVDVRAFGGVVGLTDVFQRENILVDALDKFLELLHILLEAAAASLLRIDVTLASTCLLLLADGVV